MRQSDRQLEMNVSQERRPITSRYLVENNLLTMSAERPELQVLSSALLKLHDTLHIDSISKSLPFKMVHHFGFAKFTNMTEQSIEIGATALNTYEAREENKEIC